MNSYKTLISEEDVEQFRQTCDANIYQRIAIQNADYPGRNTFLGALYCALALGEAGEAQNEIKKAWRDLWRAPQLAFDRAPRQLATSLGTYGAVSFMSVERRKAIALELGDMLWYLSVLADELGYSLEDIMTMNLEKLSGGEKRRG